VGPRLKVAAYLLVLIIFFAVAQAGCSSMKVKMGWRVDLMQTRISSMQASLPKGPAIAPGEKSPLVVTLTQPNGQVLFTEGQGAGKVMWKDLQVTATTVLADEKGNLSPSGGSPSQLWQSGACHGHRSQPAKPAR